MSIGKPPDDPSAALQGRPAFLQGRIPGATSSKGPFAQARAVFGGVAPARADSRTPYPGRTARIANPMPDKALRWMQLLRVGPDRVALSGKACCDTAFSPQQRSMNVALAAPQPARRGRGQDDSSFRHGGEERSKYDSQSRRCNPQVWDARWCRDNHVPTFICIHSGNIKAKTLRALQYQFEITSGIVPRQTVRPSRALTRQCEGLCPKCASS